MPGILKLKNKQDWETPVKLYKEGCSIFDVCPSLDVCATKENTKCANFFTEARDGLKQNWDVDFFMNPPYRQNKIWIKKAYEEHLKYNVNALALIFAKTDTTYWHEYIESKAQVHFIKGRIRFHNNGKPSNNLALYPSVWVFWKKRYDV